MKDEQTTCTPCEQNFEDNINELVDQVEDYTRKDRMRKERLCGNGYLYLVLLYDINVYLHVNSLNNE